MNERLVSSSKTAYQIMLHEYLLPPLVMFWAVLESEEELEPKSSHLNVINIHGSII